MPQNTTNGASSWKPSQGGACGTDRGVEQGTAATAMTTTAERIDAELRAPAAIERVLVVAQESIARPLCLELLGRGAAVAAADDIGRAAAALRRERFDIVIVAARADADATALMIGLARAATGGKANILLLIDFEDAARYGAAIYAADEIIGASVPPKRIADATGVGQRG
jgi:hypothetical protein